MTKPVAIISEPKKTFKTPERIRRNSKKWHDKKKLDPDWVETKNRKGREYYWENREKCLEVQRKSIKKNHAKIIERKKRYYRLHKYLHRKGILNKFGNKCVRCGYSEFEEGLDIHHIKGKKIDPNLVIVLCRNCHQALHNKKWKMEELTLQNQLQL